MADCLIGLGSNLGNRAVLLDEAIQLFSSHARITLIARSSHHATQPVGGPAGQGVFLNAAIRIHTSLEPPTLLDWARVVEQRLGRRRRQRWGPRVIDLDLLLYDQLVLETNMLVLPHPRMAVRRFVLEPALEVAPDMVHPLTGWTITRLLDHLDQTLPFVVLAGAPGSGKKELAEALASQGFARTLLESPELSPPAGWNEPVERWRGVELERLGHYQQRLGALPDLLARGKPGVYVVSDFWLSPAPVIACTWYDDQVRWQLETIWRQASADSPIPRMIAFLDVPTNVLMQRVADRRAGTDCGRLRQHLDSYRTHLRQALALPGHGLVLRITGSDQQQAIVEVTAAMDAMRAHGDSNGTSIGR